MHRLRTQGEERRAYWALVLPAFIIYIIVMAFPVVLSLALSLSNYDGGKMFGGERWGFAGLKAYARVFGDPYFWNALKNNAFIVAVSVFGQLPLGFIFAYVIYRKLVRWPSFWQGVLYVPNIISVIVVGLLWQTIFSPNGPIAEVMNELARGGFASRLEAVIGSVPVADIGDDVVQRILDLAGPAAAEWFGDPIPELKDLILSYADAPRSELIGDLCNLFVKRWSPEFLTKPNLAMLPVMFVILWMYTGMYLILFLANMQKIDSQIIEAARIDGASEWQVMRSIILPSLSGTMVNSAILAISGSLSSFSLVFAMTGGGPSRVTEILAIYMYNNAFLGRPNLPLANAISLITVVISLLLIALTKAVEKRYGGKEE